MSWPSRRSDSPPRRLSVSAPTCRAPPPGKGAGRYPHRRRDREPRGTRRTSGTGRHRETRREPAEDHRWFCARRRGGARSDRRPRRRTGEPGGPHADRRRLRQVCPPVHDTRHAAAATEPATVPQTHLAVDGGVLHRSRLLRRAHQPVQRETSSCRCQSCGCCDCCDCCDC